MKKVESLVELRKEYSKIKSVVAGDTKFVAQALMFLIEELNKKETKNGKRQRSHKRNENVARAKGNSKGKENVTGQRDESPVEVHRQEETKVEG